MFKKALLLLIIAFLAGCHQQPRLRISSYFGSVGGMTFPDAKRLGRHNYAMQWNEKSGMVYTCRGGFIDLGHLREAADRTYYVSNLIYNNIMGGKSQVVFRVIEPSQYKLRIVYPPDWRLKKSAERQVIARDISAKLGQQIAHTSLIWHEMITWYGFASTGLFSEQISSFSWEDTYSDALGTNLAVKAMRQNRAYNTAMTDLIYKTLLDLQVQSPDMAKEAFDHVKGQWFEGGFYFFVKMNKRNFDIGLNNGKITPWLVPDICSTMEPEGCPIPHPQKEDLQGFTTDLTLNPMVREKSRIYETLSLGEKEWIRPAEHFPLLMQKIVQEATQQCGPQVVVPFTENAILSSTH